MVDTHASGACGSNAVRVQISSSAPIKQRQIAFVLCLASDKMNVDKQYFIYFISKDDIKGDYHGNK